jgi:hypothetical protein
MMAIGCRVWDSPSHGVPLSSAVPFIVFAEDRMRNEKKERGRREGRRDEGWKGSI